MGFCAPSNIAVAFSACTVCREGLVHCFGHHHLVQWQFLIAVCIIKFGPFHFWRLDVTWCIQDSYADKRNRCYKFSSDTKWGIGRRTVCILDADRMSSSLRPGWMNWPWLSFHRLCKDNIFAWKCHKFFLGMKEKVAWAVTRYSAIAWTSIAPVSIFAERWLPLYLWQGEQMLLEMEARHLKGCQLLFFGTYKLQDKCCQSHDQVYDCSGSSWKFRP